MIILGAEYTAGPTQPAHQNHDNHDSYAPPVSPDQLGGSFEFLDLNNQRVTAAAFGGHWTLLFFGYARCRGSCPVATPKIIRAAQMLRAKGIKTRAVFVDIRGSAGRLRPQRPEAGKRRKRPQPRRDEPCRGDACPPGR